MLALVLQVPWCPTAKKLYVLADRFASLLVRER
jgi:hypothetical protein